MVNPDFGSNLRLHAKTVELCCGNGTSKGKGGKGEGGNFVVEMALAKEYFSRVTGKIRYVSNCYSPKLTYTAALQN